MFSRKERGAALLLKTPHIATLLTMRKKKKAERNSTRNH